MGLSQEFYVRFVQLFGVYGGVIFFWPELFHIVDGRNPAPPGMHKTLQKMG